MPIPVLFVPFVVSFWNRGKPCLPSCELSCLSALWIGDVDAHNIKLKQIFISSPYAGRFGHASLRKKLLVLWSWSAPIWFPKTKPLGRLSQWISLSLSLENDKLLHKPIGSVHWCYIHMGKYLGEKYYRSSTTEWMPSPMMSDKKRRGDQWCAARARRPIWVFWPFSKSQGGSDPALNFFRDLAFFLPPRWMAVG